MKIFVIITALLLVTGCSLIPENIDLSTPSLPAGVTTMDEAFRWMKDNITYTKDSPADNWQSPMETYSKRTGDCEDFSILAVAWADLMGLPATFVFVKIGDNAAHAIVRVDGVLYEPQIGFIYTRWPDNWNIAYEADHSKILGILQNHRSY